MAVRGKLPKTADVKKAEGNAGKRAINENEPRPQRGAPRMPKHLSPDAKKHWTRLAPILEKARVITLADGETFGALCEAIGRYNRAEQKMQDEGEIISGKGTKDGKSYKNPWLVVLNEALKVIMSLSVEFGMTPLSRARISVPPEEDKDSPLSLYLSKGGKAPVVEEPPEEEPQEEEMPAS